MSGTVTAAPLAGARADLVAEEAALGSRAAAGDGAAFATLYERYEGRIFNLCYRITGSRDDAADAMQEAFVSVLKRLPNLEGRELVFGSYLFTAARNACYDLIAKRKRAEPTDEIPESAPPVGAGAGGAFDPGDPGDDPERNVLLADQQEEIRAANAALPERQREVLALFELEDLSYDEIAAIMEMNRNSVAQLISRARINLRAALRGTALGSIAASSPDCERALPLIAARQDGQLEPESEDLAWLLTHLSSCDTCSVSLEAMEEAGASYRAWAPIAAAPWLFRDTVARAAEAIGADWSEVVRRRRGSEGSQPALVGRAAGAQARPRRLPHRRLDLLGGLALTVVLLLVVFAARLGEGGPADRPAGPAAEQTSAPVKRSNAGKSRGKSAGPDPGGPAASRPSQTGLAGGSLEARSPLGRVRGERRGARDRQTSPRDETAPGETPSESTPDLQPQPTPPAAEPPPPTPPPSSEPPTKPPPEQCYDRKGRPIPCPSP